jgi:hypothetical protein
MFSTSKGMIASTPDSGDGIVRTLLRTCLCASALVLAGLTVADPALGRSPYDGAWSVTVMNAAAPANPRRATVCRSPTEWSWPATAARLCRDASHPAEQ